MISLTHSHWFEARRRNDLTMMMKKLENSRSDNEIFKSGRKLVHNSLINQSSFFHSFFTFFVKRVEAYRFQLG